MVSETRSCIKTSTTLQMGEPRNAATFRAEDFRREAAGEGRQVMPTSDKGKANASKGGKKPLKPVLKDVPASGANGSSGLKRSSEGPIPQPRKERG